MLNAAPSLYDAPIKQVKLGEYTLCYDNDEAAEQTINEIFDQKSYYFFTDNPAPFIIDAGANIGISCLFFKTYYPQAKIVCFEPDPNAFALLRMNVEINNLKNVKLVNAALSKTEGAIDFYGQVHANSPDSRGNSIFSLWGLQRLNAGKIKVNSVRLSSYINTTVDFLKLDIEGAEQKVLEELGDKLGYVDSAFLEVHQANRMESINDLERIVRLLNQHSFELEVLEKNIADELPEVVKGWVNIAKPRLHTVKASKNLASFR